MGTPVCRREGGKGSQMAGGWVVEGGGRGGGGGGLHSSNGMRESLSNRCRGGARSPRWLLRTLMSFSLGPRPSSLRHPRPANHPLDGPRVVLHLRRRAVRHPTLCRRRHYRRCRCSFSLPLPYSAASHGGRCPFPLPAFLSFSPAPREAAMTRVNLPQTPDRYRRTSASLSALLRFFLRPTADNCHPPHPILPLPPPLQPSVRGSRCRTPCNEPTNAGAVR